MALVSYNECAILGEKRKSTDREKNTRKKRRM